MFLQHLVEQAYNIVKSERKPRRNVQYRDVGELRISFPDLMKVHLDGSGRVLTCSCTANAVARVENLEFLTDVVPKTVPYKQIKQKQVKEGVTANGAGAGQATLDGHIGGEREEQATNGAREEPMDVDEEGTEAAEEEEGEGEVRSPEPRLSQGGQHEVEEV